MAKKILIVDDSRTVRASLRNSLLAYEFIVLEAENGYVAIRAVGEEQPDLIFADVMMPRLDGYKFCAVVKSNPVFSYIPVIMLTSKDGMIDQARAQLARADGYMVKPFTRAAIQEVLAAHSIWQPPAETAA